MTIAAMRRRSAPSILGFLTRSPDHRGAAVVASAALALLVAACDSRQLTTPDANMSPHPTPNPCATVGCGAPPMCSTGCQSSCGCCSCLPGERNGDLVCTDRGCYEPAPAADGGVDAAVDAGGVCSLPFEAGPCEAAFQVYAWVDGACVKRTYGGCMGNGNRFPTLEECLATCAGTPIPGSCPPNRVEREICLSCGLAGGCGKTATVCALVCDADAGSAVCAESGSGFACYQGVCQASRCI